MSGRPISRDLITSLTSKRLPAVSSHVVRAETFRRLDEREDENVRLFLIDSEDHDDEVKRE